MKKTKVTNAPVGLFPPAKTKFEWTSLLSILTLVVIIAGGLICILSGLTHRCHVDYTIDEHIQGEVKTVYVDNGPTGDVMILTDAGFRVITSSNLTNVRPGDWVELNLRTTMRLTTAELDQSLRRPYVLDRQVTRFSAVATLPTAAKQTPAKAVQVTGWMNSGTVYATNSSAPSPWVINSNGVAVFQ